MATSDMVIEADSGFVRNIRSPGSSDLVTKVNGKDMNRYNEEREEMVGEGLFSFDEDMVPEKEAGSLNESSSALDLFCDIQSDGSFVPLYIYIYIYICIFKILHAKV
ncbi:unnamed protein product [Wuchereria bancrofti]|uniref:Uncharacterized protein n=1 Tax=Wuchereria bancrofti TaxID=6293 RepID=A0A3P7FMN5_WUCBA|nr:unnamed protein product [Wuchereria bancrofti]